MRSSQLGVAGFLLSLVSASALSAPSYRLFDLGTLGGTESAGVAINASGQMTGWSRTSGDAEDHAFLWDVAGMMDLQPASGKTGSIGRALNDEGQVAGYNFQADGPQRAFRWNSTDLMQDLPIPAPVEDYLWSEGVAINASGHVAGYARHLGDAATHALYWDGSGVTDLNLPGLGGTFSRAVALNDAGQVAGFASDEFRGTRAFRWHADSGMTDLGTLGGSRSEATAINASGQVTGWSMTPDDLEKRAFRWDPAGGMTDLGTLGGTYGSGTAINDAGQVTGYASTSGDAGVSPFLWDGSEMIDLGTLGGTYGEGTAINASGQVTGFVSTLGDAEERAFLWDASTRHDLNDLIVPLQPNVALERGWAINDYGQIVANGRDSSTGGLHAYLVSPMPVDDLTATAGAIGKGRNKLVFVDLAWTDSFDDESGFRIERAELVGKGRSKRCASFVTLVASVDSATYRDITASSRTAYCYQVTVLSPTVPPLPSNFATAKTS